MLVQDLTVPTNEVDEVIEWVVQAQAGDSEAFSNIVERYQRPVYNLCYRMLGNPGDAEDAAQESFFRAFKALNRYDKKRKFSTWILSIASHYCIDQLRKRRLVTFSMDAIPYLELSDKRIGPEDSLVKEEKHKQVQDLLAVLGPIDKAAVVMRYWYDYSYDEIAENLGITNSAVKSRLHRARKTLSEAWVVKEQKSNYTNRIPYGARN